MGMLPANHFEPLVNCAAVAGFGAVAGREVEVSVDSSGKCQDHVGIFRSGPLPVNVLFGQYTGLHSGPVPLKRQQHDHNDVPGNNRGKREICQADHAISAIADDRGGNRQYYQLRPQQALQRPKHHKSGDQRILFVPSVRQRRQGSGDVRQLQQDERKLHTNRAEF
jgi:hypothetical protein